MQDQKVTYRRRRLVLVILIVLVVFAVALYVEYKHQRSLTEYKNTNSTTQVNRSNLAINTLGEIAIKDRASRSGYKRSEFSDGWAMVGGCDVRNIILQRDLIDEALNEDLCTVMSGTLQQDPYTNKTIFFTRGKDTSDDIQIDHVVALSDAWQKGAQDLSVQERFDFANDPLNLLAVDGPTNMFKGDADASEWLPDTDYRCRYVARQIAVKIKYSLWATQAELNAFKRVLHSCPNQELPSLEESL